MRESLASLAIDVAKADFFVTHHHGDHFGLVVRLIGPGSAIYISSVDAAMVERIRSGEFFRGSSICAAGWLSRGSGRRYLSPARAEEYKGSKEVLPYTFVEDGDSLEVGDYRFRCIATPGHSRGHLCLYEPERKILFSGITFLATSPPVSRRDPTT